MGHEMGVQHHEAPGRASWLGMMQAHLRLVRDLLAPDGSVWVHVDDWQFADCRVLMNKVYGRSNFVSTVVVQKLARNDPRHFAVSHDYLLVFTKDAETWQPNLLPRTAESEPSFATLTTIPAGRGEQPTCPPLFLVRTRARSGGPFGTVVQPPARRSWRFTQQRFEELDRDGRIGWSPGGRPTLKLYLSEAPDKLPTTVWSPADVEQISKRASTCADCSVTCTSRLHRRNNCCNAFSRSRPTPVTLCSTTSVTQARPPRSRTKLAATGSLSTASRASSVTVWTK